MRDLLNSPRLSLIRKREKKKFKIKIYLISFLVAIVIGGLIYLARIDRLNIASTEVKGNNVTDTEALVAAAGEVLEGKYLFIIPKTNLFFYPKEKIKVRLADKFKRLETVEVEIENTQILEITVTEREPKHLWCGENYASGESAKCYFTDAGGYIFDTAPYFSNNVYYKFFGKIADAGNPVGNTFASEYFSQIVTFIGNLEAINLKPNTIILGENFDGTAVLPRHRDSVTTPEIRFKINDDLGKVIENLSAAITTNPLEADFKKNYSRLEYIDLRFGNKVYYKFSQ